MPMTAAGESEARVPTRCMCDCLRHEYHTPSCRFGLMAAQEFGLLIYRAALAQRDVPRMEQLAATLWLKDYPADDPRLWHYLADAERRDYMREAKTMSERLSRVFPRPSAQAALEKAVKEPA
jgi:hypothetical protein